MAQTLHIYLMTNVSIFIWDKKIIFKSLFVFILISISNMISPFLNKTHSILWTKQQNKQNKQNKQNDPSFFQLTANTLVFLCVNLVGIFVHNLMEHAQRRTFLDTRYNFFFVKSVIRCTVSYDTRILWKKWNLFLSFWHNKVLLDV
jgi:hypothetical protein